MSCAACQVVTKMNVIIKFSRRLRVQSNTRDSSIIWHRVNRYRGTLRAQRISPTSAEKNLARDGSTQEGENELCFLGEWRFTRWMRREVVVLIQKENVQQCVKNYINVQRWSGRDLYLPHQHFPPMPPTCTNNAEFIPPFLLFIPNIVLVKLYCKTNKKIVLKLGFSLTFSSVCIPLKWTTE